MSIPKSTWETLMQKATQQAQTQVADAVARATQQAMQDAIRETGVLEYTPQPAVDVDSLMASILADPRLADIVRKDVEEATSKALSKVPRARVTRLVSPEGVTKEFDHAHEHFDELCFQINLGENVALVGEAGSGKTFGAFQCAEALGLTPYLIPFNGMMSTTMLMGQKDPHGNYKPTPLYEAYTKGGLAILDEYDRGNSDVTIILNGLLAGDRFTFADGLPVRKHPDFRVVACQNTTGHGSSKAYASAQRQDGSTLNRFTKITWNIDSNLEVKVALAESLPLVDRRFTEDSTDKHHACTQVHQAIVLVQTLRAKAKDLGYDNILISPRQSISTAKLVASGRHTPAKAVEFTITNGLASDVKKRLLEGAGL